jgi:hypothetical protein
VAPASLEEIAPAEESLGKWEEKLAEVDRKKLLQAMNAQGGLPFYSTTDVLKREKAVFDGNSISPASANSAGQVNRREIVLDLEGKGVRYVAFLHTRSPVDGVTSIWREDSPGKFRQVFASLGDLASISGDTTKLTLIFRDCLHFAKAEFRIKDHSFVPLCALELDCQSLSGDGEGGRLTGDAASTFITKGAATLLQNREGTGSLERKLPRGQKGFVLAHYKDWSFVVVDSPAQKAKAAAAFAGKSWQAGWVRSELLE